MLTKLKVKTFYSRPLWVEAEDDLDSLSARKISYEVDDIAEAITRRIRNRILEKPIFIRSTTNDFQLA